VTDKRFTQPFPFTTFTPQVRIAPIAIHATSANGVLLKIEVLGIWHSVNDSSKRADLSAFRADQHLQCTPSSFTHAFTINGMADIKSFEFKQQI
jgi:hypothetical protein